MSQAVSILRRAQRELEDLPQDVYQRVAVALRNLVNDPRPPGCQRLSGRDAWRIRVGDYRVLYAHAVAARRKEVARDGIEPPTP